MLICSCSETHVTTCCSDRLLILGWKLPPRHTSSCRLRGWEVRWRVMFFIKQKALSGQLCHHCETMTHSSHFDTGPRSKPLPVLCNFIVGRVFYCLFYLAALDKAAARGFAAFSRESLDVAWEPAGRVPANGLWQWPRSAQTSRWCAFHWTWGLWEPNVPPVSSEAWPALPADCRSHSHSRCCSAAARARRASACVQKIQKYNTEPCWSCWHHIMYDQWSHSGFLVMCSVKIYLKLINQCDYWQPCLDQQKNERFSVTMTSA